MKRLLSKTTKSGNIQYPHAGGYYRHASTAFEYCTRKEKAAEISRQKQSRNCRLAIIHVCCSALVWCSPIAQSRAVPPCRGVSLSAEHLLCNRQSRQCTTLTMSSLLSAEKLATLRSVAGPSLPNSKLRSALIRAGDLNLAANRLLSENHTSAPLAIPQPRTQPPESTTKPSVTSEVSNLSTKNHQNMPSAVAHVRRLAWRKFYCEHHQEASKAADPDKKSIDEYIVRLWKRLGSAGRDQFTKTLQQELDADVNSMQADAVVTDTNKATSKPKTEKQIDSNEKLYNNNQNVTSDTSPKQVPKPSPKQTRSSFNVAPLKQTVKLESRSSLQIESNRSHLQQISESRASPLPTGKEHLQQIWPRRLVTLPCRGIMLTSGKNVIRTGEQLDLAAPPVRLGKSRDKNNQVVVVRFCKKGRELGRLAPGIAHALAPALQSGFVQATAIVVWVPKTMRVFTEVDIEVSIYVSQDIFNGGSENVEAGLEPEGEGVDAKRVNVVAMISSLKICENQEDEDAKFSGATKDHDSVDPDDPGAVTKKAAESYYRTTDRINEKEALEYEPPQNLTCTLREYQRVGVKWMVERENLGSSARVASGHQFLINPLWKKRSFPDGGIFFMNSTTGSLSLDSPGNGAGGPYGGILADEMGLGKTVQCIACVLHDIEQQKTGLTPNRGSRGTGTAPPNIQEEKEDLQKVKEFRDQEIEENERRIESKSQDDPSICDALNSRKLELLESEDGKEIHPTNPTVKGTENVELELDQRKKPNKQVILESHVRRRKRSTSHREGCEEQKDDSKDPDWGLNEGVLEEQGNTDKNLLDSDDDFFAEPKKRKAEQPKAKKRKRIAGTKSGLSILMTSAKKMKGSSGGTLIVCPTSLVAQWINQIGEHVAPNFLRAKTHYGQNRGDSESISLAWADIVVTSYGTLTAECSDDIGNNNIEQNNSRDGPLFQLAWRRVILDEAHTIKGRSTQWAKACYRIQADRKWCVTGTVIHNHVNDVFSLLHFLDVKPWSSWAFWNRGVVANLESSDMKLQKQSMSLIRDIISSITLRRKKTTKDSQNNCIVALTKKTVEIVELIPSSQERDFYNALHEKSKVQFDTYVAQGKLMRNYASVLELLLRLRQACDHPYLVFAAAPSKDSVLMKDKNKLFQQFMEAGSSAEYIESVFRDAQSGKLGKTKQCPLCLDLIDDPVAPRECGHPACRSCMSEALRRTKKCPVCRVSVELDSIVTLPRPSRFSVDLNKKWRSSAKIDQLLKDVKERQSLRERGNGKGIGKTIIFSQFTSMLDLVGTALDRERFKWLRIDGSVPQKRRASILEQFETEDEISKKASNILLISLRAGGVGLNLVTASFAILLDIHWNPQVDAQAQDRIHRHGQTRDVIIKRYIVKESVEEKLLQVQKRKQSIADGALDVATDEDKKQARLSELKLLFSVA